MPIFEKPEDYAAFERVLEEAVARTGTRLLAYCVLSTHWHLVLWPQEDGELSRFTGWLTLTHTQRWHAHRHSIGSGHVYQGRFKSFPVQDDERAPDVAELPSQGGRLSKPCWQCCKTVAVWSATVDRGYVDEVCDSSARQLPRQCGTLAMLCSLGSPASQSIRKTTKGTD
jgi:hypothetical protein